MTEIIGGYGEDEFPLIVFCCGRVFEEEGDGSDGIVQKSNITKTGGLRIALTTRVNLNVMNGIGQML